MQATDAAHRLFSSTMTSIHTILKTPPASRCGCYYCFQTLDPEDKEFGLQSCVQCDNCYKQYHARCWDIAKPCTSCHNDSASRLVGLPVPTQLRPETRMQGIPIRPSTIIVVSGGQAVEYNSSKNPTLQYGAVFSRGLYCALLAVVFILIASFIGTLAYPFYQLVEQGGLSISSAADLVFDPSRVRGTIFTASLLSSTIAAFVFFRPFDSNRPTTNRATPLFLWMLAGIIGLLLVDTVLMRFSLTEIIHPEILINENFRVLTAQIAAAFAIIIFTPIYNRVAPEIPHLEITTPLIRHEWFAWARLIIVSVLLTSAAAYITSRILLPLSSRVWMWRLSLGNNTIDLEPSITIAFLIALIVAALVYISPSHRGLKSSGGLWRFLLIILAGMVIFLIARTQSIDSDKLLTLILVAVITAFLLVPIQRVLS